MIDFAKGYAMGGSARLNIRWVLGSPCDNVNEKQELSLSTEAQS